MSLISDLTGVNADTNTGQYSATKGAAIGGALGMGLLGPGGALLGSGIGNAAENALKGPDKPAIGGPNAATMGAINDAASRSQQSPDAFAGQFLKGTKDAGGIIDSKSDMGLGGDAASFGAANSDALNDRAKMAFGDKLGSLNRDASFAGLQTKMQLVQEANKRQIDMANLKSNIDTRVIQAQYSYDQARMQVMGQFIGGIGSLGGMAAGNGLNNPTNPTGIAPTGSNTGGLNASESFGRMTT